MSESQQPTLDDFQTTSEEWRRLDDTGAQYGRRCTDGTLDRAPEDAGQCLRCGREIEREIQRTMGDEHGRVPACKGCASNQFGHEFQSTTNAVVAFRTGKIGREGPK